jgi:FkbM family methyltransferase
LARRVGPEGQVAAFEPNPRSFARLERHRRMNRLHWLKAYQAAVSDLAGETELHTYGDLGSTFTHLAYLGEAPDPASAPIGVRTLRLDDLVGTGELRPPRFVKIDVEGHGHHALAGMAETLRASRPILTAAFHSPEEVKGIFALLDPLRYDSALIGAPGGGLDPIVGAEYMFTPRG